MSTNINVGQEWVYEIVPDVLALHFFVVGVTNGVVVYKCASVDRDMKPEQMKQAADNAPTELKPLVEFAEMTGQMRLL